MTHMSRELQISENGGIWRFKLVNFYNDDY